MRGWTDGQRDEDVGGFCKTFFLKLVLNYFHNTKNLRLIICVIKCARVLVSGRVGGGWISTVSFTYLDHCNRKQHDSPVRCLQ